MFYVGVDGCKAKVGWFAIKLEGKGKWETRPFHKIRELWNEYKGAELILIDIPIGLPDSKDYPKRSCDIEARKRLGKKHPSVFPVPCREATKIDDLCKAKKINREILGRSINNQTWGIVHKIRYPRA